MNEFSNITSENQVNKSRILNTLNTNKKTAKKAKDLGKSEFLKLLVTQLEHQDPLNPMEDKEFIAQMAQFSSLEQMVTMNNNMQELKKFSMMERLNSLLGKKVRVFDKKVGKEIVGRVEEVNLVFEEPRLRIGKGLYKSSDIIGIIYEEKNQITDKVTKSTNLMKKGVIKQ